MSTARGATAAARRLVSRHKAASVVAAACLVAVVSFSVVAGSAGRTIAHTDPSAPAFSLAVLGQPGQRISLSQFAVLSRRTGQALPFLYRPSAGTPYVACCEWRLLHPE